MPLRRLLFQSFWSLLSVLITLLVLGSIVYVYMSAQLPDVSVLKDAHMQVPLRVFSADHKLMAEFGSKRRIPIHLQQVPKPMIDAILAVEDARYYSHPGVDFVGLIRAAKAVILTGRKVQGASTITMQVARNFFLTRKKTYTRKIKEILLALKIDRELSKNKVLELYLNKVYFGQRAYGIAAAAQIYYGKSLDQLTLPEMAMLAGLPQAPSRENPLTNPKSALIRRNHVLSRMLEVHFINQATYQEAIDTPLTAKYHNETIGLQAPYVAEMVRQLMIDDFGQDAYNMGLTVTTTVLSKSQLTAQLALRTGLLNYTQRHGFYKPTTNLGTPNPADHTIWLQILNKIPTVPLLQRAAVISLNNQSVNALLANGQTITIPWTGLSWARTRISKNELGPRPKAALDLLTVGDVIWVRKNNNLWQLSQIPQVQGALVSLNPNDGAVTAITGGYSFYSSKFNRATQARRQAGSSFKPFIYSAALAQGYTLASMINDAPVTMQDTGENELWRPQNDTLKFYGPTRLRIGLTKSRNLVSVRLLQDIGIPYALNYIQRFGFNPKVLPNSLSLALGSASISPLKLAEGYAAFANGGYQVHPYFITQITDQTGKVIYHATPPEACSACETDPSLPDEQKPNYLAKNVLPPQNAYIMTQALRGVIQTGTGHAAKVLKRTDLAGKTGTTNKQVDAWFNGFNSHVCTIVWVGFDNLQPLHEYGAQAALPIWIQFMGQVLKGTPTATMAEPNDIVTARIDPKNGLLARPGQKGAIFEVFRKSYEPQQYSAISQDNTNNTSTNHSNSNHTNTEDDPLF